MMQKIEIRLTLSRLVTQNVCVMGIFYLYLLHLASRMNHWLFWKKLGAGGKIFSRNKEIKYLQNFKYNLPSDRCTYIYIYIYPIAMGYSSIFDVNAKVFHCFRNTTQVQGRKNSYASQILKTIVNSLKKREWDVNTRKS